MGSNIEATTLYWSEETDANFVDWTKILGLKQSQNNQMEFSKDSHSYKLRMIIDSFTRQLLKRISSKDTSSPQFMLI